MIKLTAALVFAPAIIVFWLELRWYERFTRWYYRLCVLPYRAPFGSDFPGFSFDEIARALSTVVLSDVGIAWDRDERRLLVHTSTDSNRVGRLEVTARSQLMCSGTLQSGEDGHSLELRWTIFPLISPLIVLMISIAFIITASDGAGKLLAALPAALVLVGGAVKFVSGRRAVGEIYAAIDSEVVDHVRNSRDD